MATNLLVNTGKSLVIDRLMGAAAEPKYVGWGTGAGETAPADTDLFSPSADEARVAGVSTKQTTTVEGDTYQVEATLVCVTNPKTVTNVGLFTAPTGGSLFLKGSFAGIPLDVGDQIFFTIKWQIQ